MMDPKSNEQTIFKEVERFLEEKSSTDSVSLASEVANQFPEIFHGLAGVLELMEMESRVRRQKGLSPPSAAEYCQTFPQYESDIREAHSTAAAGASDTDSKCTEQTLAVDRQSDIPNRPETDTSINESAEDCPLEIDRYVVRREVAKGSFGVVLLARDVDLSRDVAIKLPHRHVAGENAVQEMRKEAQKIAALQHEYLVSVFDYGIHSDGRPYVVTEYLGGQSLRDRIDNGNITPNEATQVVQKIAEGLHYAHRQGTIHRDVKPANIVFDQNGQPKLIDFGMSLVEAEQLSPLRQVAGTPAYMAPEQIAGDAHHLDGRCDIWALGVILFEIWAKRRPFRGATSTDVLEAIAHQEVKPLQMVAEAPTAVTQVVDRCLRKPIAERYPTAKALADDLAEFLETSESDKSSIATPPPGTSSRNPYLAIGGVTIACVALLALTPLFVGPAANPGPGQKSGGDNNSNGALTTDPLDATVQPVPDPNAPITLEGSVVVHVFHDEIDSRNEVPIEKALPFRSGDSIRVRAELSQYAYAYVVWISKDGVLPLYPWSPGDWNSMPKPQSQTNVVDLPEGSREGWPMEVTDHMETVLLIASTKPLESGALRSKLEAFPVPTSASPFEVLRLDDRDATIAEKAATEQARLRAPKLDTVKLDNEVFVARQYLLQKFPRSDYLIRAKAFWNPPLTEPE